MQAFEEVEQFLKAVLVVALSETTGLDDNGTILASEGFLQMVNGVIRGTTEDVVDEPVNEESESGESSCPAEDDVKVDAGTGWAVCRSRNHRWYLSEWCNT